MDGSVDGWKDGSLLPTQRKQSVLHKKCLNLRMLGRCQFSRFGADPRNRIIIRFSGFIMYSEV